MLITQREAARRLSLLGLSRRRAVQVLEAGFAGQPMRTTTALLYDESAVHRLTTRQVLNDADLAHTCEHGVMLTRRFIQLDDPQLRATLEASWRMTFLTRLFLHLAVTDRPLPLIATVGGFVAAGFEITGVAYAGPERARLELRDPGPWFDLLRGYRLTRPPTAAWQIRGTFGRSWFESRHLLPPWNQGRRRQTPTR